MLPCAMQQVNTSVFHGADNNRCVVQRIVEANLGSSVHQKFVHVTFLQGYDAGECLSWPRSRVHTGIPLQQGCVNFVIRYVPVTEIRWDFL